MNKFYLCVIGISILLLSACGTEEVNGNNISVEDVEKELDKIVTEQKDSIEYPIGVQNGDVSKEYYRAILTYYKISEDFNEKVQDVENNSSQYSIEERLQKHIELVNEQIISLNEIKHEPSSDIEREIDKYFSDVLYYDEEMSNYKAKYYSTKDETYYDLAEDYATSFEQSGKLLNEVLVKYDLMKK